MEKDTAGGGDAERGECVEAAERGDGGRQEGRAGGGFEQPAGGWVGVGVVGVCVVQIRKQG